MAGGTQNVKIGVCDVTYDGNDLGLTKGGVEVEVSTDTYEVTVDQYGGTEVNEIITGRTINVTVPMAETTVDNMVKVMPGATLVEDSATGAKRVDVESGVNMRLLDIAAELKLHPRELAESDKSEDLIIPQAATPGSLSFAYNFDSERVYNVSFKGYPDLTQSGLLFTFGDPDA